MAAATQTVPAIPTLEEYLRTSYRPDCDFVDGFLEERNVGEYEHSTLQIALGSWFFNRRSAWKIRVASEYRTRITENRVRVPDISVFPQEGTAKKVRTTPLFIAIEILSPEDRPHRVITRLMDFALMGVPNIWLIDPLQRVAYTYHEGALRLVEQARREAANSPVYLDLPEIFSALD